MGWVISRRFTPLWRSLASSPLATVVDSMQGSIYAFVETSCDSKVYTQSKRWWRNTVLNSQSIHSFLLFCPVWTPIFPCLKLQFGCAQQIKIWHWEIWGVFHQSWNFTQQYGINNHSSKWSANAEVYVLCTHWITASVEVNKTNNTTTNATHHTITHSHYPSDYVYLPCLDQYCIANHWNT